MVLVAAIVSANLSGQQKTKNGDLYLGPEIKSEKRGTLEDIVGMDSDGYYMVRAEPKNFYLEKYDLKLNLVKSEEIELGRGADRRYLEFAEQLNGEIYLFTTQYDNTARRRVLFAEKVNRKTLKPEEEPIQLTAYDYRNKSDEGYFDYNVSRDSSKILIYYDSPGQSNTGEKFGISVHDSNLNTLWNKELELPFKNRLYTVERYKVDNQGNAYLLGLVYRGQVRDKKQGRPNYEYHLLVYNQDDEYTEYLLSLQNKFITDMQFEISRTGDIICAGLYSDFGTSSVKGTFYLLIDGKTREIKKEHYEQFDPSFLVDFMSEKRAGKGRELTRYNLNQLEIRRDGGVVLVAEQFFVRELQQNFNDPRFRSPFGNPFLYPGYFYYPRWRFPYRYGYPFMNGDREIQYNYNDIIVINIDPNGSIQWAKRIPKRQRSKDDGGRYSSYAMSVSKGKMHFVFNDNPKNLHKKSGDQRIHNFTKGKESVVVLVSLDGRGEVEKEPLFQVKDTKTITKPLVCEQISRDQMIIYSERNRKATFGRLTFQ